MREEGHLHPPAGTKAPGSNNDPVVAQGLIYVHSDTFSKDSHTH